MSDHLDWNRLRSGDNRALDPDHQDVFDLVAEQRAEIERLREIVQVQMATSAEQARLRDERDAEIERLRFSAGAAHKVADDLEDEIERLHELLMSARDYVQECCDREVKQRSKENDQRLLAAIDEALGR